MKFLKYIVLLSVLLLCDISNAEKMSQSFKLESPLSGISYGPFVLQDNFVVKIDSAKYLLKISPNGFLQLKDTSNNTVSEPYEFTRGRMIRINDSLLTITDVKEIPYVKPLSALKSKPITKPAPKPVVRPVVTTAAVTATVVKPTKTTKPAPAYKQTSEMWATTPKPNVKTTTKAKPQPKPIYKPKPTTDASTYFTTSKYKPQPKKTSQKSPYQSASTTVPYKPRSSKSKLRPHKDIPFSDRLGISVDISALEKVNYDFKLAGIDSSSNIEISRNSMAVKFKVMPFTLELGKVMRADWGGQMNTPNLPFQNLDLSNGSGWWWDLNYRHSLWENDEWLLSATADGSYRKEDYDLSYGAWVDVQNEIPANTNVDEEVMEEVVVVAQELASTTESTVFTEKMFKLGLSLSYKDDYWGCWASADMIAYHAADIESKISTAQGDYTIDVERTDPFIFTLGASIQKAGVNWFSTISLAGESAIRFGANYKF